MDVFSVISLIGGLAFFLYGMHILSSGLSKMAGGSFERTLKKMTSTKLKALGLGAAITVALQSSSTLTVILVGLVNSGILDLSQTIGVIMGSNIGTTLTAWILSLSGIESTNVFIKMLKPENLAPIAAFCGIVMMLSSGTQKKKDIGEALIGFAILMYAMKLMSSSVAPLADVPEFKQILVKFTNPLLGVAVGAIFTGIIQSSAASVGILQAFALTGLISYGVAIPIIMGQNIGTCVTALISSIGVSKNAKRVGVMHISFNIIGSGVCLVLFYIGKSMAIGEFLSLPIGITGIAVCHSLFNVFTTAILYPFSDKLVWLSKRLIKDDEKKQRKNEETFIDDILFKTPSFALSECLSLTKKMAHVAAEGLFAAEDNIFSVNPKNEKLVEKNEARLDTFEDHLGTYLVRLASSELSEADSARVSQLLHSINDFERLGDHSLNLVQLSQKMRKERIVFSEEANGELNNITEMLKKAAVLAFDAFDNEDAASLEKIVMLKADITNYSFACRNNHIERLKKGTCTIESGFVFCDFLANTEQLAEHLYTLVKETKQYTLSLQN